MEYLNQFRLVCRDNSQIIFFRFLFASKHWLSTLLTTNTVVFIVTLYYIKDLLFHTCIRTSTLSPSGGADLLVSVRSDALCVEV